MLTMTLCLLLCGVVQIYARPLREQEARLLAEQFFQKNTQMQQLRSAELTLVSAPACTANGYELHPLVSLLATITYIIEVRIVAS